jgi:hypothetical protein
MGELPNTGEYYTIDTLVGMPYEQEGDLGSIQMHPNPSMGNVVFDFDGGEVDLMLYNSHGVLVYNKRIFSGEIQDVSFLKQGVYYAELSGEIFKLVKL